MANPLDGVLDSSPQQTSSGANPLDDVLDGGGGAPAAAAPQKGFLQQAGDFLQPIGNALKPALAAMPSAAIGPLESGLNLYQKYGRSQQNMPGGAPPLSQMLSNIIPAANETMGTSGPYLDATGQINKSPWMFGQSPNELAAQNPASAFLGNVAGGLPYAFLGGAGAAAKGAPLLGQLAKAGATAAAYSGAFGGLEEAGQEVKDNDQLDPGKIAKSAALNAAVGAPFGAAVHGALHGLGTAFENYQMGQAIKNVQAQRVARNAERDASRVKYITGEDTQGYPTGREYQPPQARDVAAQERADQVFEEKNQLLRDFRDAVKRGDHERARELKERQALYDEAIKQEARYKEAQTYRQENERAEEIRKLKEQIRAEYDKAIERHDPISLHQLQAEYDEVLRQESNFRHNVMMREAAERSEAIRLAKERELSEEEKKWRRLEAEAEPLRPKTEYGGPIMETGDLTKYAPTKYGAQAPRKPPELKVHAEIKNYPKSWRDIRTGAARNATSLETSTEQRLAELKVDYDTAVAKLESAGEQLLKETGTKARTTGSPTPEQKAQELWPLINRAEKDIKETTDPFVESALQKRIKRVYKFAGKSIEERTTEVKALSDEANAAYAAYRNEAKALVGRVSQDIHYVKVGVHKVNIREKVNIQYEYHRPSQELKIKEAEARIKAKAPQTEDLSLAGIKDAIENQYQGPDKGEILKILNGRNGAKLLAVIGAAATAYAGSQNQAQAAEPISPEIVSQVVGTMVKSGLRDNTWTEGIVKRITGNQMVSDVLRNKGFDADSKAFGIKRDVYLTNRSNERMYSREMNDQEQEETRRMSPEKIRNTPLLKGWTQQEKNKAASLRQLDINYEKELDKELARLEKLGINDVGLKSVGGKNRFYRFAKIDKEQLTGPIHLSPRDGIIPSVARRLTGGIVTSLFLGNARTASLHIAETVVTLGSQYQFATTKALTGLASQSVYREYCIANSPTGQFQKILEGTAKDKFEWQKKIDQAISGPINKAIKSLPGGEALHATISMKLPESSKLGIAATITAQHFADKFKYPGGATAYMQDSMNNAKYGTPIPQAKKLIFAKVAINAFVASNERMGLLPDGPIKELTMFQRHAALAPWYPLLRAQTVQARFLAGLMDDILRAARTGDKVALAQAIKTFVLAQILITVITGHNVLPGYIWAALEGIDNATEGNTDKVEALKDALDNMTPGHYMISEFGPKWIPALRMPALLPGQSAQNIAHGLAFKSGKTLALAGVNAAAMAIMPNIGPMGTSNLFYIGERLYDGFKGTEEYKKYGEYAIADTVMNRPWPQRLVKKDIDFDMGQGVLHSLLRVENPDEVAANREAERQGTVNLGKDFAKIGRNISNFHW